MPEELAYTSPSFPPLLPLPKALAWKGRYDEFGNRCEVQNVEGVVPLEKVYQRLRTNPNKLAEFCKKWQIVELGLFGSVLRDDFRVDGKDPSDVDLLYVFAQESNYSLFDLVNIREELGDLFQRAIDLVSKSALQRSRNWLRRQEIFKSGMVLYEEE